MTNPPTSYTTSWDTTGQGARHDLRSRLRATRWPGRAPGDPWQFGTDVAYLEALCTYWARKKHGCADRPH